jgi:hypothetical protein
LIVWGILSLIINKSGRLLCWLPYRRPAAFSWAL